MIIRSAIAVILLSTTISLPVAAADLSVKIDNIKTLEGQLHVYLMDEKGFEDDQGFPIEIQEIPPSDNQQTVIFEAANPGQYAIIVFQDLNQNDDLDLDFWGNPVEPSGISNNPPSFEWKEGSFVISKANQTVLVSLE